MGAFAGARRPAEAWWELVLERARRSFAMTWATTTLCAVALLLPQRASAQAKRDSADARGEVSADARAWALMEAGVEHFKQQRLDRARGAFLAAWEVRPHYAIAASLAEVEMIFGHYLAAAGYWEFFLGQAPADWDEKRRAAGRELERCREHLAVLTLEVSEDGAEVLDNGKVIGRSPFERQVWVDAGVHTFEARSDGRSSARQTLELAPGSRDTLKLSLPEPERPPLRPGSRPLSHQDEGSGIELRLAVTLAGAGLAVVAAGIGVGFALKANAAERRVDELAAEVRVQGDPDLVRAGSACSPPPGSRPAACEELSVKLDEQDSAHQVSTAAFFTAGLVGVGALATYFIWPSPDAGGTAARREAVTVGVHASGNDLGAWIAGAF
jgi:hypothetical protein